MRPKPLLFVALLGCLGALAWVRRAPAFDPYALETLGRLVERPVHARPGTPASDERPFWEALLAPPFTDPTEAGAPERGSTLRLVGLISDPTVAHASAARAGELLELEAEGPDGPLGVPLWRALLEGPLVEHGTARTLRLYGCRHTADLLSGPALEHSYVARLALAEALEELARLPPDAGPLTILGRETPIQGGACFDVRLVGERQTLELTLDGRDVPPLRVERSFRAQAPNDARARAHLVEALRQRADAASSPLTIEGLETPAAEGVDVRLEWFGGRLVITARRGTAQIMAHLVLEKPPDSETQEQE